VRILITGGTGLLGKKLLETLGNEHQVYFIARNVPKVYRHTCIKLDLSKDWDIHTLPAKMDVVIHLAQSTLYREFPEHANDIYTVNLVSTMKLLDYSINAGVKKFVLASTGGIYKSQPSPITENSEIIAPADIGFYFATKLSSEIFSSSYRNFFEVNILRLFFMYGVNQRLGMFLPSLISKISTGDAVSLNGPSGIFINPIHVSKAAEAIRRIIEINAPKTLNIAGNQTLSIREISEAIGNILEIQPNFKVLDPTDNLVADTTSLKTLVGEPTETFDQFLPDIIRDVLGRNNLK
jgi:UDP-glucose 4-epimerase